MTDQEECVEVPIVRVERTTAWFAGPVASLPPRKPFISPDLLPSESEVES